MNKARISLIIVFLVVTVCLGIYRVSIEAVWANFRDYTSSNYYDAKLKEWSNKPTDFLIDKLGHPSDIWDGVAGNILAKRKDLSKESKLIKIVLADPSQRKRASTLGVLFSWDIKTASDLSMGFIKEGGKHPLYYIAMLHLSHVKHPPAFPYLEQMAKQPDGYENGSVNMLKDFGRPEAIPILEKMLSDIKEKDPFVESLLKGTILEAIKSLKNKNN